MPFVRKYLLPVSIGVAAFAVLVYALLVALAAYSAEWIRAYTYIY